ncbi:MAG: V-type ATPase subunit [Firmicutes bacterium]|nr:V-type ATPase subunit [Bacillota bacterium]
MKDVEYVYAVSYIKTLENKMLTHSDMHTLIASSGIDEAKRFLRERMWVGESTEELLKNELENAWKKAYEVCPEEAPVDLLLYENDFHNLKTVLKAAVAGEKWENMIISPYITPPDDIEKAIKTKNFDELPEHLKDVAREAYSLLTSTMDGQLAEIFVDKTEHLAVLEGAKRTKSEFLIGWAELLIELTDFKTAWRCAVLNKPRDFVKNALINPKEQLIAPIGAVIEEIKKAYPEADTESVGAFEKWCDNKKLAYAKRAKSDSFGFAPIMAFLIGKSFEIKAVRIILAAKENGWGEEIIRERLRDAYV